MDKLTVKLESLREELTTGQTARERDYGRRLALADACLIGVLQHLVTDSRTPREQRTVYLAIIEQYGRIREPGFKYSYE